MSLRAFVTFCLIALAAPTLASAQVARVRGGEHADFTRIVIEAPALAGLEPGWTLGRTADGYAFDTGGVISDFDLSRAFDKIPKTRISGLIADPVSGRLRLTMPCDCHVIATEVRPGLVALDFANGPPSAASPFEASLAPPENPGFPIPHDPALAGLWPGVSRPPDPAAEPLLPEYDWLSIAGFRQPPLPTMDEEAASDDADHLLDPLRDALLRQISRGIVEGMVDPGALADLPEAAATPVSEAAGLRVSGEGMPGLWAGTDKYPGPNLTADGRPCLPDRQTDVASWLPGQSTLALLGEVRTSLLTEFDQPDIPNILAAARIHIALGFGAEARQILALLPADELALQSSLHDLSYLTDLEPARSAAFSGMESCDTPAALWAVLAMALDKTASPGVTLNTAAVTRSFSALPEYMRRHLGPVLVAWFLDQSDETTARRLRDATLRAPGDPGPQVQLMDGGLQLATGNKSAALVIAEEVLADPGASAAEAAILLAESAFAGDRSVPSDLAPRLAALSAELRGGEDFARIRRAEILTLAMSGSFREAFDLLRGQPETATDLWEIAVAGAPDDIFLEEALRSSPATNTRGEVRQKAAVRLLDHGFAREALTWFGPPEKMESDLDRMLAAQAALAVRDARLAVRLLAGLGGSEADALRARAAIQLGNADAAAAILLANGDHRAALRAEFWAGDWTYIAQSDAAGLSAAAAIIAAPAEVGHDEGILARGARLAAESEAARDAVSGLIQALPQQFP